MMSKTDAEFVAAATRRWSKLLTETEKMDATSMALAVSLWATMNVDKLLTIAARGSSAPPT